MKEQQIISTIKAFGFSADSDNKKQYSKTYDNIRYQISVDLLNSRIDFGPKIKKGDDTTSHLKNPENIVVLECVDRLLEKGYKPDDLTLEKKWKLGRTAKGGKADITIKGKNEKTLLIIECKTWGKEFESELDMMKQNGGQLFSYFQQDKNTRYLCLYASREYGGKIEKANALIKVDDSAQEKILQQETEKLITYEQAKTIKEMLEVWKHKTKGKQTFLNTGLFEPEIEPYNPGYIPIKVADLKDFGADDKGKVFNQFEEILRHNNISDRSNAFNRIISLILAKIVDENKGEDAITDFQVKEGIDDAETLLERLQSLYSKAMRDYLDEEVIDYKLEDIEAQISNFPRQTAKETLYRIYKELKFYQNNEFAFKEVYNKKLFEENAKVLEEVVRLFQKYRFKYDQKAQFLGDFFELMLESGYKQSEGQFFTPTPITKFIIYSIPLKSIVQEKLQKGEKFFLPKVVDFACGSGHFLTEAIEEIAELIKEITEDDIKAMPDADKLEFALRELRNYKHDMRWAGEYVFGIEKDYRLARTSQVACFMHGDGDANIIFGDGLEKHERLGKDGSFDVLVANPPYTIKDFKKHLNVNPHNFELWEHVTPDSDDIEVFFIERMKQLLRTGGMAGIILPSSILSNSGAYTKAREIILKYFEIKAIIEFGGNTFGATGTNTVTLFLKKRDEDFVTNCQYISEDYIFENKTREGDFINSKELFENYITHLELEEEDYKTFISRKPNKEIKKTEFYKSYKNWFDGLTEVKNLKKRKTFKEMPETDQEEKLTSMFFDLILEIETEKFFYFLLTHRIEEDPEHFAWYNDRTNEGTPIKVAYPQRKAIPQKTLIVKTGRSTKEQEKFLGYKFSNRRGYKGIDFTGETLMYDTANQLNHKKANSYIYKNFTDQKIKIDEELTENLSLVRLTDCINYEEIDFDKRINLNVESKIEYETIYELKSIGSLLDFQSGLWKGENDPLIDVKVIRNTEFLPDGKLNYENPTVISVEAKQLESRKLKYGDIILERSGGSETQNIGRVAYFEIETNETYSFGNFTSRLRPFDKNIIIPKYAMILLNDLYQKGGTLIYQSGIRIKNLNQNAYKSAKIPVPPIAVQKKIIEEIEAIEKKEIEAKKVIEEKIHKIDELFSTSFIDSFKKTLEEICTLKAGKFVKAADIKDMPDDNLYPCYGGNGLRGYTETFTHEGTFPLVGRQGALCGNVHLVKGKFHATEHALVATPKKEINVVWLYHLLRTMNLNQYARGVAQPGLSVKYLNPIIINVLPLKQQEKLVEEIEKFEKEIINLEKSIATVEEDKKEVLMRYLEEDE